MSGSGQRIDKWLFFARIAKSRSLAAKLAQSGRIRVNRDKIDHASQPVKAGDVLTITLDRQVRVLRRLPPASGAGRSRRRGCSTRTGRRRLRPKEERLPSMLPPLRERGSGRPTKRERRKLDRRGRTPATTAED